MILCNVVEHTKRDNKQNILILLIIVCNQNEKRIFWI